MPRPFAEIAIEMLVAVAHEGIMRPEEILARLEMRLRGSKPPGQAIFINGRDPTAELLEQAEAWRGRVARFESRARFCELTDGARFMVWTAAPEDYIACNYVNQPWLDFTGSTLERELGLGWLEHVHPEDCARCRRICERRFVNREPGHMEYRLRRYDGRYLWMVTDAVPMYADDGCFAGYAGSVISLANAAFSQVA
jgi:PAS domain S-box-containing protein